MTKKRRRPLPVRRAAVPARKPTRPVRAVRTPRFAHVAGDVDLGPPVEERSPDA